MSLSGKKIVLGLTGGVACYKAADLARSLTKAGASVQVVMTSAATEFITATTMQALTGNPVYTDLNDHRIANNMAHIDLTRDADAVVIAPCTANFMAKLANGICDDLLSTLCIAKPAHVPLAIAPAMNVEMWQHPATQRNIVQLNQDGIIRFGPDAGLQACGETGFGRMMEPAQLTEQIAQLFRAKILQHKKVLLTAGPTFEPIDPVRGITNHSSGKMGYALARAAQEAGADVTLISGPTALQVPYGVNCIRVQTAQQMYDAVMAQVAQQDIFIAVAAVADWRVKTTSQQKLKKKTPTDVPQLEFVANPDILASVAALTDRPFCVGFAAESENLDDYGETKRQKKNIPLLVGNLAPQTFGQDLNTLTLFEDQGKTHLKTADKYTLAQQLISHIAQRVSSI